MLSVVNCENKEVILFGDLNCYYLIANDYKEIKDTVKINGLKQIIDKPTRISKDSRTIIDIASSDDSKIGDKSVFPSCLSDHKLVGVIRKMHIKRFTPRKVFVRDYSKFNVDNFKNDLRNAPWANMFLQNNMNSAWNEFKSELTAIINRHAPLKEKIVRGKPSPCLTTSLRNKMHEHDYLLKVARGTGSEKDWSIYK